MLSLAAIAACATLGTEGQGDLNLPSSGVGPFRKLSNAEVRGVAPYLLDVEAARYREPAIVRLDDDPRSARAELFVVAQSAGHDVIVRTHADDGRTFYAGSLDQPGRVPAVALVADQAWEGADLSGPSALRVGNVMYLYYAANGSIGLARSQDGATFAKVGPPVFSPSSPASAPSVAQLPDGSFRMLYVAGPAIFEATSPDGLTWAPLDADPTTPAADPVLGPAAMRTDLAPGEKPPFDTAKVGDPCLAPRMTPAGRLQVRVLYTGWATTDAGTRSAIGFAARYGTEGALVRNPSPVLSLDKEEAGPALLEWLTGDDSSDLVQSNRSLLFVHMDQKPSGQGSLYPAIAGAVGPATITLEPPGDFPDTP